MVFRRCKRRSLDWSSTLQPSTGRIIDVSTFRYRCWYTSRIYAAARGAVVRGAWKSCLSLARIIQLVCKNNIQVGQLNCFASAKRDKKPSKKVNIFYFMNIIINNTKTDTCFRNNYWRTGAADSHLHALVLLSGASWVSAVTTSVLQSGWLLPQLPFKLRPSKLLLPDTPAIYIYIHRVISGLGVDMGPQNLFLHWIQKCLWPDRNTSTYANNTKLANLYEQFSFSLLYTFRHNNRPSSGDV
jgi:hypothetical protein